MKLRNLAVAAVVASSLVIGLCALAEENDLKPEASNGKDQAEASHKAEEEASSPRFGAGKAVIAFDKEEGFQLSDKAMKNLGVQFTRLASAGPWHVPKESIVRIKQSSGIYRRYNQWISFVLVKIVAQKGATVLIQSEDLQADDEVAVGGAHFLRMTEADLNSGTVDNCAH